MTANDGGPASPVPELNVHEGMSLRDYFAGQVIDRMIVRAIEVETPSGVLGNNDWVATEAVRLAYVVADEALKAREKEQ